MPRDVFTYFTMFEFTEHARIAYIKCCLAKNRAIRPVDVRAMKSSTLFSRAIWDAVVHRTSVAFARFPSSTEVSLIF